MVKTTSRRSVAEVWKALRDVKDPEIPVLSLVELNVIRDVQVDNGSVTVKLVPTFAGCPAMDLMRREVREKLQDLGFDEITVDTVASGSWSTDELSDETKQKLRDFGIAPPPLKTEDFRATLALPVPCPFCRSNQTHLESAFGATLCKQIFYCDSCRQSFERFKPL
ncbi:MAG: phenylacetate-CoA oxygenase subunit PaaJ [Ignavibacteriales bacterium]|nr:phenylacetate-CoA oxygenase subunit PaaJ [Ignavibacteriales bacterium]